KPREKRQNGRGVEPGDMRAATVAGSVGMRQVQMKMQLQRDMKMDDASQKRKNAKGDANQKTEEIHVGPGHTHLRLRRASAGFVDLGTAGVSRKRISCVWLAGDGPNPPADWVAKLR